MQSIASVNTLLMLGAGLVVAGIASSLVASRFGAPLLLVFLFVGMLAGENGPGGITFDDYRTTYLVGSLALAVILFDGGLRTRLSSFRNAIAPAAVLATAGVVITAALTGLVAMLVLRLGIVEGLLIGAIVASTDAAAVFFLIRTNGLQLRRRVNATLEIESSTNDPVAVFLVVALVAVALAGGRTPGLDVAGQLVAHFVVGAAVGAGGGFFVAACLNRLTLPSGLHPLFVVACAVMIYGIASVFDGSGFLAVYIAGLVIGNRPVRAFASILSFHDAATWLCQIVMFLVLGLLVTPSALLSFIGPGIAIALFLMLIGRPAAVWLCLTPFGFSAREKMFVSWVGLRGAVSIFLAAIPTLSGLPNAAIYFNIAFFVVLVSLLLQGWTVPWAARRSGVALADPAPDIRRVEIDLPGQLDLEMVGYPVIAQSPIMDTGIVPSFARPIIIVRDGAILSPEQAGILRIGDYGYFLTPPERVRRLDRLFAAFEGHLDRARAGVFTFSTDARLVEVAAAYGIPLTRNSGNPTLGSLFADTFDEGVREGDRIALGPVTLVARNVEDGAARTIALIIEPTESETAPESANPLARVGLWLKQRIDALRRPH